MTDKHLSSQFDADLALVSTRLLEMGGLVELQIARAMQALATFDLDIVEKVIEDERRLNAMEIAIDEELSNIIARRQPAARDLRLLMATSKTVTNLERAGDEARKIAKRVRRIAVDISARSINVAEIKLSGEMATHILRRALDAFARLDIVSATQIVRDDHAIDEQFRAFVRKLATYMMEDPRSISVGLDYLFIGKAIERIGDHATNIAEFIIYVAKGTDVRHLSPAELERRALDENE
ncbi:phosphate signaling complex protein PhoU [Burkholderia cepacia]|uniref:Phosphate-specific transport system accessory protein PhoU n=1 Tax=Burkholderia cepacia TaxID=292 RepID=A0A8I1DPM0_BURCE|nr:phosphate signaling complex protein PhoU [Burkholderia cepacia]MBA9902011.1 phosphate transport system regulatory protein PhoU [Burkholderia cepacia]MBA9948965.1 phosphate transport system regulatory protein PhoU [Burkholderia cepacia]MBA9979242.1 phosphate transport system regulatory protein PhoU [Burkholderia cepacia]MBA9998015.1 phosphate transport system regulatory protein PhoU [Burkholderia cepacia]MBB0006117.1 phosphate transport system regulatory protein PhoU [Burkholderia cepacia]